MGWGASGVGQPHDCIVLNALSSVRADTSTKQIDHFYLMFCTKCAHKPLILILFNEFSMINFIYMAKENINKIERRGGAREGAGRPKNSGEKTKICVSVHERNWNTALKRWKRKPSWLVDRLILTYVKTEGSILETEAAI